MKISKRIALIILILVTLMLSFLAYMGLFNKMTITEKQVGPYTIVYEDITGAYTKTGPVLDNLYKELKADGIEATEALGLYYDDPKNVPAEKLRCKVGIIITPEQEKQIDEKGLHYSMMTIDQTHSIVTTFPMRNKLSYMLGVLKAYPALSNAMNEKGYQPTPSLEIYGNNEITYAFTITK